MLAVLLAQFFVALVQEPQVSKPDVLRVGHVAEFRGALEKPGRFVPEKAELQPADSEDVLIGTVPADEEDPAGFALLGQWVVTDDTTQWQGLERGSLAGQRIKVEGKWRGPRKFIAKSVATRGAGRDRIAGRIDELRKVTEGWEARVMIFTVLMSEDLVIEHLQPLAEYGLAPERKVAASLSNENTKERNEEELFGQGIRLTDTLRLSGQIELRPEHDGNFDLDDSKQGDRTDYLIRYRARFDWRPSRAVTGRLELRYDQLWREDERSGDFADQNGFLGETYVRWNDAFAQRGLYLTAGREKFTDLRRWIYNQNIDAVHATFDQPRWHLDVAGGTILDDGSPRDEHSDELLAYLSNNNEKEHLAAWALYRAIDESSSTLKENNLHVGVRALGEFLQNDAWLDLVYEGGSRDDGTGERNVSAWAYDVGTTWSPGFAAPFYFTWGYALGTGDASTSGSDGNFRQTGFQDNKGKFGGVTTFRYYGELVDPELSNLGILTLGAGLRPWKKTSIDFVYHTYTQDVAKDSLSIDPVQSNLRRATLNGSDSDIGAEYDLILGYRQFADWDLEIVGSYFQAGDAWTVGDDAFLAKVQLRYRF